MEISRRTFLKGSTAAVGAVAVGVALAPAWHTFSVQRPWLDGKLFASVREPTRRQAQDRLMFDDPAWRHNVEYLGSSREPLVSGSQKQRDRGFMIEFRSGIDLLESA